MASVALVACMVGASAYMLRLLWAIPLGAGALVAIAGGAALAGHLWRRTPAYFWSSVCFVALGAVWSYHREPPFRAAVQRVRAGFADLAGQIAGRHVERVDPVAGAVSLAVFACLFAALLVSAFPRRGALLSRLLLGFLPFPVAWMFFFDTAATWATAYLACGLMYLAVGEVASHRVHPGRAAPVAAVLLGAIAFAHLLPVNFEPILFDRLSHAALRRWPGLAALRGGGTASRAQFSLAATGFAPGGEAALGGPVRLDDGVALQLEVSGPTPADALYLRARSLATYTGRGWVEDGSAWEAIAPSATLPFDYPADVVADELDVVARMAGLRTASLLVPWQPRRVELLDRETAPASDRGRDSGVWIRRDGSLIAGGALRGGEGYRVRSALPRVSDAQVRALAVTRPLTPEERESFGPYLRLPASIPSRVRDLARRLADEAESPHPWDRARAIEDYLRTIPYRTAAAAPPPGRDFVDFFLFDERGGYCTYYASAMAVLLRQVGIPARWVEGFRVPLLDEASRNGTARLTVRNRDAHAWVEAYFPGYGWVAFEPTAAFSLPDRAYAPPAGGAAPVTGSPPGGPGRTVRPPRDIPDELLGPTEPGVAGAAARATAWGTWLGRVVGAAVGAIGLALGGTWALARRAERIPREPAPAVRAAYRNAAAVDGLLTRPAAGEEGAASARALTPTERLARLGATMPHLAPALNRLATTYQAARYSRRPPTPAEARAAVAAWEALRDSVRASLGRWRYEGARLRRAVRLALGGLRPRRFGR